MDEKLILKFNNAYKITVESFSKILKAVVAKRSRALLHDTGGPQFKSRQVPSIFEAWSHLFEAGSH